MIPFGQSLGLNKRHWTSLLFFVLLHACHATRQSHYVHWNSSNPIFRIDNTDHIIDVNRGNQPWEYDQVNIICPMYTPGTRPKDIETYIIYSVSKDEYESCRITDPNPRVIAQCNKPHELMYFTITFRSFTPTPNGMEFKPGRDYYFISTSANGDLHRQLGGRCSTHNMKVQFKVADNQHESHPRAINVPRKQPLSSTESTTTSTTRPPSTPRRKAHQDQHYGYIYDGGKLPRFYGDLSYHSLGDEDKSSKEYELRTNEIVKHEASRMAASSGSNLLMPLAASMAIMLLAMVV